MKVVAYGIQPSEKGILAHANQKKHDITLIANPLSAETAFYAQGKEAVIVFAPGDVPGPLLETLARLGIRYIVTRFSRRSSNGPARGTTDSYGIRWASVTVASHPGQIVSLENLQQMAAETILHLDTWQLMA
jgi:D-lactate dehydrogenase